MSYYINTYEVPIELLSQLKALAPNFDEQEKVFWQWRKTIPTETAFDVMKAPFRAICHGKISTSSIELCDHETRFYELIKAQVDLDSEVKAELHGERKVLSTGYPGISDYEEPKHVKLRWRCIEKVIVQNPEYRVSDLLIADQFMEILADGSSVEDFIRFYYGCAMRSSATITIDS